jgi:flagella basal body P-ring formation protein FlgA
MFKLLKNFLLLFFLALMPALSEGTEKKCEINLYPKIYHTSNWSEIGTPDVIKHSNCPFGIQSRVLSLLSNINGKVQTRHLSWVLTEEQSEYPISINPSEIEIYPLLDLLRGQIKQDSQWVWKNLTLTSGKKVLGLEKDEIVTLSCQSCQDTGEKNIQIKIFHLNNKSGRTEWLNVKLHVKTKVLTALVSLVPTQEGMRPDNFEWKIIDDPRPEQYYTNLSQLMFYKLNKALAPGAPLRNIDLIPMTLVTPGVPAQVHIIQDSFNISNTAIPTRSGQFGEVIPLRVEKGNRIIQGKVIDFNKVLVEI